MRKNFALLAAAGLIALLAAPAAEGAGYGRGVFKGKATSAFDSDRPVTPIEIQVKGSRVRVVEATFVFDCGDGAAVRRTISTPFARVTMGPAGGGSAFNGTVNAEEGGKVDVTFNYGLREKSVLGNSSATFDVEGLPCMDDADFKANKK